MILACAPIKGHSGNQTIKESENRTISLMDRMDPVEFKNWLEARTRDFAIQSFKLLDSLPKNNSTRVVAYQLGKSASSIGANYREANRAESRDDFVHKFSVAVKESAESCYWFEILEGLYPMHEAIRSLAAEAVELRNLLQSINQSTRRKNQVRSRLSHQAISNQTIKQS